MTKENVNDYGFVLGKVKMLESVLEAMKIWLLTNHCKYHSMDESYHISCSNPKADQYKSQQKVGWSFNPEKTCVKCEFYEKNEDVKL